MFGLAGRTKGSESSKFAMFVIYRFTKLGCDESTSDFDVRLNVRGSAEFLTKMYPKNIVRWLWFVTKILKNESFHLDSRRFGRTPNGSVVHYFGKLNSCSLAFDMTRNRKELMGHTVLILRSHEGKRFKLLSAQLTPRPSRVQLLYSQQRGW